MYFDLTPKSKREDFFNYSHEYEELKKAIERKDKIVALIGVRRVGKTSLMKVVYNELKMPKLWIDGRLVESPKKEIPVMMTDVLKSGQAKIFGGIEGVNFSAFGVGLGLRISGVANISAIEKLIENVNHLYVFIDEAQRMNLKALGDLLSYFYDHFTKISFIISGSEVGLINELLGAEDSEHPLYGRDVTKIEMKRLDRDKSIDFLRAGFRQLNVNVKNDEIFAVIDELDGLIGWLTLYGYKRGVAKSEMALKETLDTAAQIAASEFSHFLKKRKSRVVYVAVLRHATGVSWTELKTKVEKNVGRSINPRLFAFVLRELMRYSFVDKLGDEYKISDPLLFKAALIV